MTQTVRLEPDGLLYRPDFITAAEERHVLDMLERIGFRAVTMRGQTAKRTVRHYGYAYDYESWKVVPTEPLPEGLKWLRARAAPLAGCEAQDLAQALVSRYPDGAGIGWHRDAPMFGPQVIGISLLSPCRLRLQRKLKETRYLHELELEPRSAYVLAGKARSAWQHSIPAAKGLRYSITFRTLGRGFRAERQG
jgi:alkylated DNA repair protein (DNA oxidative demethylase)